MWLLLFVFLLLLFCFFFFNDTATTEIYTLSLHDALPISALSMNYFVLFVAIIKVRFTIMISKAELKRLTSLRQRKYRMLHGQYLLEGVRLLEEALSAKINISKLWHLPDHELNDLQKSLILSAEQIGIPIEETTADTLLKVSDTVHHQGVIGEVTLPESAELGLSMGESLLYLEEIRDPGNLGTILQIGRAHV